jgi:glucokinase
VRRAPKQSVEWKFVANVDGELLLGLDIGGTKCAAIVGSRNGQIVERIGWPSQAQRGPQAMIEEICANALALIQRYPKIIAVGAAVGGPLNAETGMVLSPPNLPGWDGIPFRQILEDRLKLPARIEHDAAACCLAEYIWGAGRGTSRLIYLTCGTGFGAGIVFDGKIYYGANGASPEIGHTRLRKKGPEAFGKRGSVEAFCAGASLGKIAAWKFPERWKNPPATEKLARLWQADDREAAEVIEINARAVGQVCANLADLLRPDVILLGSMAMHLGAKWVTMVKKQFEAEALDARKCRVEPAGLGEKLQDCSALVVAVSIPSKPAPAPGL